MALCYTLFAMHYFFFAASCIIISLVAILIGFFISHDKKDLSYWNADVLTVAVWLIVIATTFNVAYDHHTIHSINKERMQSICIPIETVKDYSRK